MGTSGHITAITFTFIGFIIIASLLNPGKENAERRAKFIKYSVVAYIAITAIPMGLALYRWLISGPPQ